jgi:transcriptional regulator with XRE-family HTH domain
VSVRTTEWGAALRRQREAAGLTQDALARRLSEAGLVTAMTSVSRWELGKVTPPPHRRLVIEKVLTEVAAEHRRRHHNNGDTVKWGLAPHESDPPEVETVRRIHWITKGQGPYWDEVVKRLTEVLDMIGSATAPRKHG